MTRIDVAFILERLGEALVSDITLKEFAVVLEEAFDRQPNSDYTLTSHEGPSGRHQGDPSDCQICHAQPGSAALCECGQRMVILAGSWFCLENHERRNSVDPATVHIKFYDR